MGMHDDVKYGMDCPKCGNLVGGFQSKDGPCMMTELDFWEVNNFYSSCPDCHTWIEFTRKQPRTPSPINDYDMEVEARKH